MSGAGPRRVPGRGNPFAVDVDSRRRGSSQEWINPKAAIADGAVLLPAVDPSSNGYKPQGEKRPMTQITPLACACGQVQLEAQGAPIISTECHCSSCRAAGAKLQATAAPVLEANGGTRFVLYRKDRVGFLNGAGLLREFRLTSQSPTRRVVASCCKTPVFLEFENGHWLSLYGGLWSPGALPPLDLRTMTSHLPHPAALSDDVPSGRTQTALFYAKLLGAWIAMGFKSPKIAVNGTFHANDGGPMG
jgi:hypothetical protein